VEIDLGEEAIPIEMEPLRRRETARREGDLRGMDLAVLRIRTMCGDSGRTSALVLVRRRSCRDSGR